MHLQVFSFTQVLLKNPDKAIINISPGYNSVLVRLNHGVSIAEGTDVVSMALNKTVPVRGTKRRTVEIPVCYDDEFGPDLDRVSEHTGYEKDELIERHASGTYLVYFMGFSAGFPYIGGMDESLDTPRLKTPRKTVPAGSVGIAGKQTGIYPLPTPGGWNLIGRTSLPLFDGFDPENTPIRMGDRIRFYAIDRDEFEKLGCPQS